MKTNKLFISLLCASVAAVFIAGCTEVKKVQGPDTRDTTYITNTTEMLIPEFGIKAADVCQNVGQYSIYFTPGADWTFTSQTEWLEVVTPSGTKSDTVLTVKITKANESNESRPATTTITVGGVAKTLTFTQMGIGPAIKVFSKMVEFSSSVDTGWINNIFTNCDIVVSEKPSWVTNVDVVPVQAGYEYTIRLELAPLDYDDEDREGYIVIKDKASDYTTEVRITCNKFSQDYIVNQKSIEALKGYVAPGAGADKDRTFRITLDESPYLLSGEGELQFYFYKDGGSGDLLNGCTVKKVENGTRSAFGATSYDITFPKYTYQGYFDPTVRSIACYAEISEVVFDPKKSKPIIVIDQNLYLEVKVVTEPNQVGKLYALLGEKSVSDPIVFKVRTGLTPKVKITDYTAQDFVSTSGGIFPGSYELVDRTASSEEGWDLCTFVAKCSEAAKTIDFGTRTLYVGGKPIPCVFWEHNFCVYIDEFNSSERIGCLIRLEKAAPALINGILADRITSKTQKTTNVKVKIFGSDLQPTLEINKTEKYGQSDYPGDIVGEPTVTESGLVKTYTYTVSFNPDEDYHFDASFDNEYDITVTCGDEEQTETLFVAKFTK